MKAILKKHVPLEEYPGQEALEHPLPGESTADHIKRIRESMPMQGKCVHELDLQEA